MLFRCDAGSFGKALSAVSRVLSKKGAIADLEAIEIKAQNGRLTLRGTNMYTEVTVHMEAIVAEEGVVYLPSQGIVAFVEKLNDQEIEFSTNEAEALIKYGRKSCVKFRLQISGVPQELAEEPEVTIKIKANQLLCALQKVIPSMAHNNLQNPALEGTLFDLEGEKLTLVATDAFRLALATVELGEEVSGTSFVVPGSAIKELTRIIPRGDEIVTLSKGEKVVSFSCGDIILSSRMLGGSFPDYKRVISTSYKTSINVDQEDLLQSAERCSLLGSDHLVIGSKEGKKLTITVKSEIGTAEETIPVLELVGEDDLEIAINPKYLLDGVKSAMAEVIALNFSGPYSPIVVTSEGSEDIQLMLPMRVQGVGQKKSA